MTFELDPRDLDGLTAAVSGTSPLWTVLPRIVAVVLVASLSWILTASSVAAAVVVGIVAGLFGGFDALKRWAKLRHNRGLLGKTSTARVFAAGPEGVAQWAAGGEGTVGWERVTDLIVTRHHVFVVVDDCQWLILPKRALPSPRAVVADLNRWYAERGVAVPTSATNPG